MKLGVTYREYYMSNLVIMDFMIDSFEKKHGYIPKEYYYLEPGLGQSFYRVFFEVEHNPTEPWRY